MSWTITTQGYINGVAFRHRPVSRFQDATADAQALPPASCALPCVPQPRALHGGLVLYNGGFTTGITALILLPILEHYIPKTQKLHEQ